MGFLSKYGWSSVSFALHPLLGPHFLGISPGRRLLFLGHEGTCSLVPTLSPSGDTNHWPPRRLLHSIRLLWFIWVWINTYRYIFSGMNIHLPAILGFTRYQGFDPSPFILIYYVCNATYFPVLYCHVMYRKVNIVNVYKSKNAQILGGHFSDSPALPGSAWQAQTIVIHAGRWAQRLENESWAGLRLQWTSVKCYGENIPLAIFWSFDVVWLNQKHWTDQSIPEDLQNR